jgi:hypothetical protein
MMTNDEVRQLMKDMSPTAHGIMLIALGMTMKTYDCSVDELLDDETYFKAAVDTAVMEGLGEDYATQLMRGLSLMRMGAVNAH